MIYFCILLTSEIERSVCENIQQRTTGRIRTRVAAIRTEPTLYALYQVNHQGAPRTLTLTAELLPELTHSGLSETKQIVCLLCKSQSNVFDVDFRFSIFFIDFSIRLLPFILKNKCQILFVNLTQNFLLSS